MRKNFHIKLTYETVVVQHDIAIDVGNQQLNDNRMKDHITKVYLESLQRVFEDLKNDRELILFTNGQFSIFLKQNAILPYNDILSDYLQYSIDVEKNVINLEEL